MASITEGGTEKPSASFWGYAHVSFIFILIHTSHTSGIVSAAGGGVRFSLSSGIVSRAVPFIASALVASASPGVVAVNPFGTSAPPEEEGWTGETGVSGSRLDGIRRNGERGRSADEVVASRSFDFPFPKALNAEPIFEDDLWSGDDARPYGWVLCRRRPSTVPKRFSGFELFFSSTAAS
jgi:hypothetical protein